jgi:MoxR-like ATPase
LTCFLLRIRLGYPDKQEEEGILERFQEHDPLMELSAVATPDDISRLQSVRRTIHVSHPVKSYITALVGATRTHPALRLGASPRGSLGLMRAGQALAALRIAITFFRMISRYSPYLSLHTGSS